MEPSLHYVKGSCWRIWNYYFQEIDKPTPPLHFLKAGSADNEAIFVCPVSEQVVRDFVKATQTNAEMEFVKLSEWALNNYDWFGEWGVFVCRPRVVPYNSQRTGKRK
ncbi:hypothetical protein [Aurantimicrobium minutum]|uniref:hypothetical protein n=1 Tax=Aurantimicrobium minutum TaxID=708131 RepID=UPI00247337B7|nr:hypothetical protein [Aurantimicrobium minutum]MDH6238616.1 hypothetical protein [Aurantimicrobium minutum]